MSGATEAQADAYDRARAVKRNYEAELLHKANVVGVGIGLRMRGGTRTDQVGLVVLVRKKLPALQIAPEDIIPNQLEGVPVDVQEVGELRAQV